MERLCEMLSFRNDITVAFVSSQQQLLLASDLLKMKVAKILA